MIALSKELNREAGGGFQPLASATITARQTGVQGQAETRKHQHLSPREDRFVVSIARFRQSRHALSAIACALFGYPGRSSMFWYIGRVRFQVYEIVDQK